MRCYIWGTNNLPKRELPGRGLISFAIPDWGVQYRAAQLGTALECEYSSLVSFLRFVQNNARAFESQRIELYCDSTYVVEQVEQRAHVAHSELRLWGVVRGLREKIPFALAWVPPDQNRAIMGLLDLAPLGADSRAPQLQFEEKPKPKKPKSRDLTSG